MIPRLVSPKLGSALLYSFTGWFLGVFGIWLGIAFNEPFFVGLAVILLAVSAAIVLRASLWLRASGVRGGISRRWLFFADIESIEVVEGVGASSRLMATIGDRQHQLLICLAPVLASREYHDMKLQAVRDRLASKLGGPNEDATDRQQA